MDEDKILMTLRSQAWERAKGELAGVLGTYWPGWTGDNKKLPNGYEEMAARIKAFIKDVDDNM